MGIWGHGGTHAWSGKKQKRLLLPSPPVYTELIAPWDCKDPGGRGDSALTCFDQTQQKITTFFINKENHASTFFSIKFFS